MLKKEIGKIGEITLVLEYYSSSGGFNLLAKLEEGIIEKALNEAKDIKNQVSNFVEELLVIQSTFNKVSNEIAKITKEK